MHVCAYPYFLSNSRSDMYSQVCSLLKIKVHFLSLHWELSLFPFILCLLLPIASLELLERHWAPAVLKKSSHKSLWKMNIVEDIPSLQTSLQISTWVYWSPASAPLNPSIAVPSITFQTKTHLAWCEIPDGVQQNPQCKCLHRSPNFCAMDLNSYCNWWRSCHHSLWRLCISWPHRRGQCSMAHLPPAVTVGEQ